MSDTKRILIMGLGSPHGDDQAGWLTVRRIADRCDQRADIVVRTAVIPMDLLDWLDDIDILHVCDACQRMPSNDRYHRIDWKSRQGSTVRNDNHPSVISAGREMNLLTQRRGSHDFGLVEVLALAEATCGLPEFVTIWAIEGSGFQPGDEISEVTRTAAVDCADKLLTELQADQCMKNP